MSEAAHDRATWMSRTWERKGSHAVRGGSSALPALNPSPPH